MTNKAIKNETAAEYREDALKYVAVFQQSPDGIVLIDTGGNLLEFNAAAHTQLGYTREEFSRLKLHDIGPDENPGDIKKRMELVLSAGKAEFDVKHRTKHGEIRDVHVITQLMQLSGRQVFHTLWRDTTEQRKAEDALKEAKSKLETLIQAIPDMILLKDAAGRHMLVNKATEDCFGQQQSWFIGKTNSEIMPSDAAATCDKSDAEAIRQGKPVHTEELFRDMGGKKIFLDTVKAPLYDKNCCLSGLLCITRDITSRKNAEEELQRSEAKFRTLFESAIDGFYILDMEGNFIDINKTAYERLGYSKEEILKMNVNQINHPDLRETLSNRLDYLKKEGWFIRELVHVRKDGTSMPVEISARIMDMDGKKVIFSIVRDITERKKREDTTKKFADVVQHTRVGVSIGTLEGRLGLVNPAFAKMHGYTVDELYGMPIADTYAPQVRLHLQEQIELVHKKDHSKFETLRLRKDGSVFPAEVEAFAVKDKDGRVLYRVANVQDITERKKAKEELQRSEAKFRTLFESATDAIFIMDLEGNFIDINRTAHERLGYTKDEMLSMGLQHLDTPEFRAAISERFEHLRKHGRVKCESAHTRKDGTVMPIEANASVIDFEGKKVVFSVIRDISERKKAEEKIKAALSEKEVLLKELYHRTKNNMQVISGLLNLQAMQFTGEGIQQAFKETQDRIRAMSLVHERLYESKDLSNLDIREYLKDLCNVMMDSYPEIAQRVSLKFEVERAPMSIDLATPCGLIINELLSNSMKYAFPGDRKGEIMIALHEKGEDEIELIYSDNGTGLPEWLDVHKTKTLGLRLVNNLVQVQLKGKLHIRTKDRTEFRVNFNSGPAII